MADDTNRPSAIIPPLHGKREVTLETFKPASAALAVPGGGSERLIAFDVLAGTDDRRGNFAHSCCLNASTTFAEGLSERCRDSGISRCTHYNPRQRKFCFHVFKPHEHSGQERFYSQTRAGLKRFSPDSKRPVESAVSKTEERRLTPFSVKHRPQ